MILWEILLMMPLIKHFVVSVRKFLLEPIMESSDLLIIVHLVTIAKQGLILFKCVMAG